MPWRPLDDLDVFPTLGYDVADWMTGFLLRPDTDDLVAFVPTQEQIDFLVAFYELDPVTGRRVRHRAVLSRPRGWGKSPLLAAMCAAEACGATGGTPRASRWACPGPPGAPRSCR